MTVTIIQKYRIMPMLEIIIFAVIKCPQIAKALGKNLLLKILLFGGLVVDILLLSSRFSSCRVFICCSRLVRYSVSSFMFLNCGAIVFPFYVSFLMFFSFSLIWSISLNFSSVGSLLNRSSISSSSLDSFMIVSEG